MGVSNIKIKDVKDFVEKQGYVLISNNYKNARTPIDMLCSKGHKCRPTWDKFKNQGRRCGVCAGNIKYTLEYIKEYVEQYNYILISDKYNGAKDKIQIKCPNNHVSFMFFDNFKNKKYRCKQCSVDYYKHEKECRLIIERLMGKKFYSIRPDFLKNPKTGFNLELDGYNEELKLAFEYDGEQHYKDNCWLTKEKRENLNKNDRLKEELCKNYGIILIRIPYTVKNNKEEFIYNKIKELYERN